MPFGFQALFLTILSNFSHVACTCPRRHTVSICAIREITVVQSYLYCAPETCGKMARIYADVNQQMPRSYWDYDSEKITSGALENYEVVRKIGRGKYSEVVEGISIVNYQKCVIKALKPVK